MNHSEATADNFLWPLPLLCVAFLISILLLWSRFGSPWVDFPRCTFPRSIQKLLLIYNFHWSKHVSSIHAIREVYLPYLRRWLKYPFDVVFYASRAFPELGIESNGLSDSGVFSTQTFAVGYRNRRFNYMGYILLNDDGILDPFRFNQHNLDVVACEVIYKAIGARAD
jgi:hypothetical protein